MQLSSRTRTSITAAFCRGSCAQVFTARFTARLRRATYSGFCCRTARDFRKKKLSSPIDDVVLLELVVDPVCSLVFEAEPEDKVAMKKPPRAANESLFGRREIFLALLQGAIILTGIFGLYFLALHSELPEPEARALAFVALIASNLVLAFADSAEPGISFFDRRRRIFWIIGVAAAVIVCVVLYVPAAALMFKLSAPNPLMMPVALGVALLTAGWFGFIQRVRSLRLTA